MRRLLLAALLAAPAAASAQAPTTPTLTYKVSIGGMAAGVFKAIDLPTHKAIIQVNDVAVSELKRAIDKKTHVKITGGRLSSFLHKKLTAMYGTQMTVELAVTPIGLKPGKRCTFVLDDAFLLKAAPDSLEFRLSELPEYSCK